MRSHLAVAIDIDANIDAAEIGGSSLISKAALAAFCPRPRSQCEPAQWHRRVVARDVQWSDGVGAAAESGAAADRARGLHADVVGSGRCMSRLGDR